MNKDLRPYTYGVLESDLQMLVADFPDVEWGSIGKSLWGKELYYIKLGCGKDKIFYNGAHHGMEWITSALLMHYAREYLKAEKERLSLNGFSIKALSRKTSLYIVPMVNPDGVELATGGIPDNLSQNEKQKLIEYNGSGDFGRWQANGRGVDLNHNYDALWEKSKEMEKEYGISGPCPTRFSGTSAFSEPESRALAEFTVKENFKMVIAFHSQGKVIYQGFEGKEPPISMKIAKAFERISPYKIDYTEGIASYGGYKDWFVDKFWRPGYTIEVGEGRNPLPIENFPIIYKETLPILLGAMTV